MTYLAGYCIALLTFLIADMIWLGVMAPRFYRPIMGDIVAPAVNWLPAAIFYAIYPVGLLIFAIGPALRDGALSAALLYGALFGFFTYATYNLTSYAVLRNWTPALALVDIGWGTVLGALTAGVTAWLLMRLLGLG